MTLLSGASTGPVQAFDDAEVFGHDQRLVGDIELRPEALVGGAPLGHALETLALVHRELEADLAGRQDLDIGRLDHRHGLVVEAQQGPAVTLGRQWLVCVRGKETGQPGGRDLVAV